MRNFRSPANKQLAAALAAGISNPFGQKQFAFAINNLVANAASGEISLPADFKGHPAFPAAADAIVKAAGWQPRVSYTKERLPLELVAEARKRQADFEKRNPRRGPARTGKTARKGGRTAAERRKRERSAKDRALRDAMRGGTTKKK